jgi:hypothetical protein
MPGVWRGCVPEDPASGSPGGNPACGWSPAARVRGLEPLTRRLGVDVATSAHPESGEGWAGHRRQVNQAGQTTGGQRR